MSLRFVLDEHLRGGGLWQAIQQHNASGGHPLDVVRVGDPPDLPLGTLDPDLLLWAEREGRILLSRDFGTMPGHFAHHLQTGRHSPGLILILPHRSLRDILASLVYAASCGAPIDFQDRIEHIPL
ncbi:MAG TPA: hypothetical protein VGF59_16885 [Bryobacteraceae bacterium]|jgi:hypothetical protein